METQSRFNPQEYLVRIGIGTCEVFSDVESLRRLQRSHLLNVPFENLDIYWKRPITSDVERFFEKIVKDGRGGFCYELNGSFKELLKAIGFETRLISARVFNGMGHGPEFDHAAIIVTIGDDEFLADVGFGDFTAEPLRFVLDVEQQDETGTFMIRRSEGEYFEVVKRVGNEWLSQYIFTDTPRRLSDFEEMCAYQQTSPDSHFTKGALCSILTEDGRKTLTDKKLIVTSADQKHELPVESESDFYELLIEEFSIKRPALTERS
jgi:N-hydroxyarylamine O-acetyltransferase